MSFGKKTEIRKFTRARNNTQILTTVWNFYFSMKFEDQEVLLAIIALRMISHFRMGLIWEGDAITRALFFLVSGSYCMSFIGIWKKTKWGLVLILFLSLLFGSFTLYEFSSPVDLVQLLFWNVFPIYLAYLVYRKQE
jgi:hypothetical protein